MYLCGARRFDIPELLINVGEELKPLAIVVVILALGAAQLVPPSVFYSQPALKLVNGIKGPLTSPAWEIKGYIAFRNKIPAARVMRRPVLIMSFGDKAVRN